MWGGLQEEMLTCWHLCRCCCAAAAVQAVSAGLPSTPSPSPSTSSRPLLQACYPVADAAVLSTGGRARTAVANMGEMAAAIRRHQVHKPTQAIDDITQLPVVASDLKRPASVLARTASGALVSAPSSSVLPQAEGEELVRRAASASGAIGGTPFRTRTPTPDSPANSPGPSKLRPPGQVAVTAAAGPGAAAALASGSAGGSAASTPREQEKARAQQQMRVIEAQLKQLEDQEHKR